MLWFVCICASRMDLPAQSTTIIILNALSLGCTKLSIGSKLVSFVLALGRVPVKELFKDVGYWRRTRVSQLVRAQKRVIVEKHRR